MKTVVFFCALVVAAIATVALNHLMSVLLAGYTPDLRWVVLAVVIVPPLYFLPAVLAASKSHPHAAALFLVNTALGWTGAGWLACLFWAASAPGEPKPYTPLIMPARPAPKPASEVTAEAAAKSLETLVAQRYNGQITEAEYLAGRQMIVDQWGHAPLVAG